ncbi:TRIC cation channel family protein [Microbulbifer agarilyticus]
MCIGGLIRDLICNRPPLFFKSDIYALAPVVGASVCYVLLISGVSSISAMSVGALIAFAIRFATGARRSLATISMVAYFAPGYGHSACMWSCFGKMG